MTLLAFFTGISFGLVMTFNYSRRLHKKGFEAGLICGIELEDELKKQLLKLRGELNALKNI